jgi:hypothetical protein
MRVDESASRRPSVRKPKLLAVQVSRAFVPPWLRVPRLEAPNPGAHLSDQTPR